MPITALSPPREGVEAASYCPAGLLQRGVGNGPHGMRQIALSDCQPIMVRGQSDTHISFAPKVAFLRPNSLLVLVDGLDKEERPVRGGAKNNTDVPDRKAGGKVVWTVVLMR